VIAGVVSYMLLCSRGRGVVAFAGYILSCVFDCIYLTL